MKELNTSLNDEEIYFYPHYVKFGLFIPIKKEWNNSNVDRTLMKKGWIFTNKINCEYYCAKINKAIKEAL